MQPEVILPVQAGWGWASFSAAFLCIVRITMYCSAGQNSFTLRALNLPWLHGGCVQLIYRMAASGCTTVVKGICVTRPQCLKPKGGI